MLTILNFIFKKISYIISPPYCSSCRKKLDCRAIFCNSCYDKINPIIPIKIIINKNYSINVYAISEYNEPLKSLILAKKSSNFLASKHLGQLIWQMTNIRNLDFDFIVPIPLHFSRQIKRGYNQTEIMSQVIAKESKKSVLNILQRSKMTKYQFNLNKNERLENLKNAFTLKNKNLENLKEKNILIIDDLFTTGSTLISAANELIKLKPKTITAVVACRVI